MTDVPQPHWDWFFAGLGTERVWGQVCIRPNAEAPGGFELRHLADRASDAEVLTRVPISELREIARFTVDGRYRPLTGAPNLRAGWTSLARDPGELAFGLHQLYPGSVADAWWVAKPDFRPIDFATVAGAQLGKAAILCHLQEGPALAATIQAGCSARTCIKHRRWMAAGTPPDDPIGKSAIPCVEPCPFFLGFARACAEIEHKASVPVEFAPDDLATLAAALRHALDRPPEGLRDGEMADPLDSRRVARVLVRYSVLRPELETRTPTSDE